MGHIKKVDFQSATDFNFEGITFIADGQILKKVVDHIEGVDPSTLPLSGASGVFDTYDNKIIHVVNGYVTEVETLIVSPSVVNILSLSPLNNASGLTNEITGITGNISDIFSKVGHGLSIGQAVFCTTQVSSPTTVQLHKGYIYYVISDSFTADQFKLSHVLGGPSIDITSGALTGSFTLVPFEFSITFNKLVERGIGNIYIKEGASTIQTISVTGLVGNSSSAIHIVDNKVYIYPVSPFSASTTTHVEIDSTAFVDFDGNYFPGISDSVTWNFSTI